MLALRLLLTLLLVSSPFLSSIAQYYLRGEIKDPQGNPLAGVRIYVASKGEYPYYSGSSGSFGIPTSLKVDSVTFIAEGFELLKAAILSAQYATFVLKPLSNKSNLSKAKRSSLTRNFLPSSGKAAIITGESYAAHVENEFIDAQQYPETGFALHVDRASYSNIRRFITNETKPPVDAVRIEEMLNYFNFKTADNSKQQPVVVVNSQLTECPWQPKNQLLFLNIMARKINLDNTPPANLVFLIDVSGSMEVSNRLGLLKSAFKLLVENLRAQDTVSIITYGTEVLVRLIPTSGADKEKIIAALEGLEPAGSTPGESAIRLAYRLAKSTFMKKGMNRVIMATDGDFNVGITSDKELEELVSQEKQTGIYLTCLGVGMGNYKDSKLEGLARMGNGNFAYLDTEQEAEKVLVEEFSQTIYSVANNVYATATFNTAKVKSYRLIGFDNKREALTDSNSMVEGGELGSGHSLMVAFEIEPQTEFPINVNDTILGNLCINYRYHGKKENQEMSFSLSSKLKPFEKTDSVYRFATSVVMFGSLLRESVYAKDIKWGQLKKIATESANPSNALQKEFVQLIEKAEKISAKAKKKKLLFFKNKRK